MTVANKTRLPLSKRTIILLIIFVVGLYIILPQISSLHSSVKYLKRPNYGYLLLGLLFSLATYLEAALSYTLLAFKKLTIKGEILIQSASMFINNLLPAGIGGLGANYSYLKHEKHSSASAASVVAVNNLLGITGHTILFTFVILISGSTNYPSNSHINISAVIKVTTLVILVGLCLGLFFGGNKVEKFIKDIKQQLLSYRSRYQDIFLTLIVQMTLTLSNVLALYFCIKAVGIDLSFIKSLFIFTFASGIKNATPTPGGLGGYEASLLAGLVAYSAPVAQGLAAVLFFRLVNFWLPLLIGLMAFIYADRKKLFSS